MVGRLGMSVNCTTCFQEFTRTKFAIGVFQYALECGNGGLSFSG
jgi:hypothetical protein